MRIEITASSRIHFGLTSTIPVFGCVDGGAGLSIEHPKSCIIFEPNKPSNYRPSGDYNVLLENCARKVGLENIYVELVSYIPRHVGLGSGTQAALMFAKASDLLTPRNLPGAGPELWERAGRGRTSKVGCALFEKGGYILDLGRPSEAKVVFGPSSASQVAEAHDRTLRLDSPLWDVIVVIPRGWQRIAGHRERREFARFADIGAEELMETAFMHTRLLTPSILEKDIRAFDQAIRKLRSRGIKGREMAMRGKPLAKLVSHMESLGLAGVILSSWGPATVGFSAATLTVRRKKHIADELRDRHNADVIWTTVNNCGCDIKVINA